MRGFNEAWPICDQDWNTGMGGLHDDQPERLEPYRRDDEDIDLVEKRCQVNLPAPLDVPGRLPLEPVHVGTLPFTGHDQTLISAFDSRKKNINALRVGQPAQVSHSRRHAKCPVLSSAFYGRSGGDGVDNDRIIESR